LEVIQGIKDEPLKNCPNCDKEIERQFPLTSKPQFKGKGFYETDYKSNKKT
jgi:predicted nucleic acid-binding Zn ribbon protein